MAEHIDGIDYGYAYDTKVQRATQRAHAICRKRLKYERSCTAGGSDDDLQLPKPHRSQRFVRAATRTRLAKGWITASVDVPKPAWYRNSVASRRVLGLRAPKRRLSLKADVPAVIGFDADATKADEYSTLFLDVSEDDETVRADVSSAPSGEPAAERFQGTNTSALAPDKTTDLQKAATTLTSPLPDSSAQPATSSTKPCADEARNAAPSSSRPQPASGALVESECMQALKAMLKTEAKLDPSSEDFASHLLHALWANDDSGVAVSAGVKHLRNMMARDAHLRTQLSSKSCVEILVSLMQKHQARACLQADACCILKEMAAHNKDVQQCIFVNNGVWTILRMMHTHLAEPDVQTVGCGVLRNMSSAQPAMQAAIVSQGGLQIVVAAMRQHKFNASVQWACCWTVYCLLSRCQAHRVEAAGAGLVELVRGVMTTHKEEPKVMEAACWALKELAVTIDSGEALSQSIQCVADIMHMHSAKGVKDGGRVVLRSLVVRGAARTITLRKAMEQRLMFFESGPAWKRCRTSCALPTVRE